MTGPLDTDGHTHAIAFDTTQITSAANRSNPKPGDPCHPLAAGAHVPAVAFSPINPIRYGGSNQDTLHHESGVLNTLPVGSHSNTSSFTKTVAGSAVRRLTARECERLQGFPDDYTLIPWRKGMASDGPRYKAIGCRIQMVDAILQAEAA
jgi:DNA (cytosine-5)-methyltransferase 1